MIGDDKIARANGDLIVRFLFAMFTIINLTTGALIYQMFLYSQTI